MKKYLLLIFLLAIPVIINAQDTLTNFINRVNYIFANVDHSKVTTGLLSDYGLQTILPSYYDGAVRDSNEVDINAWRALYSGMDNSRFNDNCTLPQQSTVFSAINSNLPASDQPMPIISMCINYNELYSNADSAGLVTINNDQIFDVSGKNPYATKTLFAACPLKISYIGPTVQFVLKNSLYYTNAGKTISSITADMGDGNGTKSLIWDVPFSITYSSPGNKSFVITFSYTDGSVLKTHGKIVVNYSYSQQSGGSYYYVSFSQTFPATQSYSGATVSVCLSNNNTDGKIHKPIIVAKGFDPWKIMNDATIHIDVKKFLNLDGYYIAGNIDVPITPISISGFTCYTLESYLYHSGYDIVFVDYDDGTDDIFRNAALLEDIIKWVNNNKVGADPNVVMGISMGGLVARYALRHLETQGYNHQTRLYISMDSPHNGANVPVGVQAALLHISTFGFSLCYPSCASPVNMSITITPADYVKQVGQVVNLFNSKAAKQMLIYNVSGSVSSGFNYDNSTHQAFMTTYNAMGFPQNCFNIAISDGSGIGTPDFAAGSQLASYSQSWSLNFWQSLLSSLVSFGLMPESLLTSLWSENLLNIVPGKTMLKGEMNINAIGSPANNTIYHGRIYYQKKILWLIPVNINITNVNFSAVTGMVQVDGAPGGTINLSNYLTPGVVPNGLTISQPQFCFIPAVSALALNNWSTYLSSNLNTYNLVNNGQTLFQNYFSPMQNSNLAHTDFSASADYVYQAFANCTLLPAAPAIIGPAAVCSSGSNYVINNLPPGVYVNWTPSSNITQLSNQGLSNGTFNTSVGYCGNGTIQATLRTNCVSTSLPALSVWVGTPAISNVSGPSGGIVGGSSGYAATLSDINANVTSYNWALMPAVSNNYFNPNGSHCYITWYTAGYYALSVNAVNTCGASSNYWYPISVSGSHLSVSPNPATNNVQVSILKAQNTSTPDTVSVTSQFTTTSSQDIATTYTVKIYNSFGTVFYSTKKSGDTFSVPVNILRDGTYIIEANDGKNSYKQQLIIKH